MFLSVRNVSNYLFTSLNGNKKEQEKRISWSLTTDNLFRLCKNLNFSPENIMKTEKNKNKTNIHGAENLPFSYFITPFSGKY